MKTDAFTKASLRNMVSPKTASLSGVEKSAKNAKRNFIQIQIIQTKWNLCKRILGREKNWKRQKENLF